MAKKKHNLLISILIACSLVLTSLVVSIPRKIIQAQVAISTPTPGPDGKIIWIVKSNDTLLSISLITGVPVDTLRQLNNLTGDTIIVGQKLIIGLAGPALVTPTLGPSPTPTPILPTPSPKPGSGSLCIILFNDVNGDSLRQESEASIPGGAISINNRIGSVSLTADSDTGTEHKCFKELPEGEYTISVAVPQGYNATTNNTYVVTLRAGDETYIDFGAQANSQTLAEAPLLPAQTGQKSPLLGIVGVLFLLAGVGVAIFAARLLRSR
jgi:LysM domain/SdrD B-like domain